MAAALTCRLVARTYLLIKLALETGYEWGQPELGRVGKGFGNLFSNLKRQLELPFLRKPARSPYR